jgi:glucosamine-6-phosphate deaminase
LLILSFFIGKTPEYFIKTLEKYRGNWNHAEVIKEREGYGFPSSKGFPDTSNLRFVMLDEFFPMLPTHRNSFCNYIRQFYTKPLGIKDENILDFNFIQHSIVTEDEMNYFDKIVDLSLLTKDPDNELEKKQKAVLLKVQEYCESYEEKIKGMGGIGFFLGGIGPDGHIAFNQEGSEHSSKTRLVSFNYPSAAGKRAVFFLSLLLLLPHLLCFLLS